MAKLKDFRLILLAVLVLAVTLILDLLIRRPDLPPADVVLANLTDQSATIAWTTRQPAQGGVVLSTQSNKLLRTLEFVFFPKNFFRDELNTTTHSVFLTHLSPDHVYYYRIFSGGRFWKEGSDGRVLPDLKTLSPLAVPSLPRPIFGQLLDQNSRPLTDALVSLFLVNASNFGFIESKTLTAFTNQTGHWQLDLGNLRTFDGQKALTITDQRLCLVISAPDGRHQTHFVSLPVNQNAGQIMLR